MFPEPKTTWPLWTSVAACLTICLLLLTGLTPSAGAQSQQELDTLQLFYPHQALVESATRNPQKISRIAENVTVVTAEEIEAMNAHSVAEVLNRIPGLWISFTRDFGAASLVRMQGSSSFHVRVLLDGITWNFLSSGNAETNTIPVGIIERIEIIRGPASSAWGSALGGVVNIITKSAGTTPKPGGLASVSLGANQTYDARAQLTGPAGSGGFYLYAGSQGSDGLRSTGDFDNQQLYAKLQLGLARPADLNVSLGYSQPHTWFGDFPDFDISSTGDTRTIFGSANLNAILTPAISLEVSIHHLDQSVTTKTRTQGLGIFGPTADHLEAGFFDESTSGGSAKFVFETERHTLVAGMDIDQGRLDQKELAGFFYQTFLGVPAVTTSSPDQEQWAVYLNDSIDIGRWALTPGLRYDHNSVSGDFLSPSLGVTYRMASHSIFRASIARGFTTPPLAWTSGGGLFLDPNPELQPEEDWSYQAGFESAALGPVWVKTTLFYHELDNAFNAEPSNSGSPFNAQIRNRGSIQRQGFELELKTVPVYHLSLSTGFAFVHVTESELIRGLDQHTFDLGIRYDDQHAWRALLFGKHVRWDSDPLLGVADFDDFIWDFDLVRKFNPHGRLKPEIFFSVHNLFDGSHIYLDGTSNPDRWAEGGIRLWF